MIEGFDESDKGLTRDTLTVVLRSFRLLTKNVNEIM
jgi:hypothetical protein